MKLYPRATCICGFHGPRWLVRRHRRKVKYPQFHTIFESWITDKDIKWSRKMQKWIDRYYTQENHTPTILE